MLKELPREIRMTNGSVWHPKAGFYFADDETGRIWSEKRHKWLRPSKTNNDYWQVHLQCEEGNQHFYVHRLMWETFNGPIPEGMQVNHINEGAEGKKDNRLENLNLMTPEQNSNFGTRSARSAAARVNHVDMSKQVYQYSLDGELVRTWPSTKECGRNGFHQGAVAACCRGCYMRQGNSIYKGYRWSYTPL